MLVSKLFFLHDNICAGGHRPENCGPPGSETARTAPPGAIQACPPGRLVSEMIFDGIPSLSLEGFRLDRFTEGALAEPRSVL